MLNTDILKQSNSEKLTVMEKEYWNSQLAELKYSINLEIKKRIKNLEDTFDVKVIDFFFEIERDYIERNMNLIISNIDDTYNLNLFIFEVVLDKYDKNIKNFIIKDNILQLATIKDSENREMLDIKKDILKDLNSISQQNENKIYFNILTDINRYHNDFSLNNPLIKIHFEYCMTLQNKNFDYLLSKIYKYYHLKILYIPNKIIFGHLLKEKLTQSEFNEIDKLRGKISGSHPVMYSDIKDLSLKKKIESIIINYSQSEKSDGFCFNDI